ncbi:lipid kinase, YegS/Rv2252/BmrU family [Alteribacillus persepolensis]|uniref:Lipid kinase, YegS/Rv2252/BmrU family n=1 Tax=Alteribacillus persepolensis TaxID=568899 RepID=A0A1G8C628_9BACI|nr:YegS/Rv2252/BmrU family lipid kinase [Alteribacillus persepolensis]SDH40798.1 lipid kinase, YegS/Rv2252/BmrU family [Alteribacillus persepolensis]
MFKRALLLINGNSEQADKQKSLETVSGVIGSRVKELVIFQTQYKGHTEAVCYEHGHEYDVIFVLGGDGTLHECVNGTALLKEPPVIGILPGGTCNDFSRSLGIPQSIKRAAESLITGDVQYLDIGRANDRYFANFYGIGLIAETSGNINENLKNVVGKVSYYISALQTVHQIKPFPFMLQADDETIQDEAVMVLITNGNYIGTNQLPFQTGEMNDGIFDVFVIREGGQALLREYINAKTAFSFENDQTSIQHYQATEVRLETQESMDADSDGEIYMKTPVFIQNFYKKLPFLVPYV